MYTKKRTKTKTKLTIVTKEVKIDEQGKPLATEWTEIRDRNVETVDIACFLKPRRSIFQQERKCCNIL